MTILLLHHLSKEFPNELMVTVPSFKSSSVQHDVYFVNSHPTQGKIDERMWGMSLDVATL